MSGRKVGNMVSSKNIVIICILILCTVLISSATYAVSEGTTPAKQHGQEPSVSIDKIIGKMTIYLSMTDEQARQIKPVLEKDMEKRSEIIKNGKGDKNSAKSALDALRQQTNNNLSQYLTEEQMKKLEEMQKAQQDQTDNKKGGTGGKRGMGGGKMFNRGVLQ